MVKNTATEQHDNPGEEPSQEQELPATVEAHAGSTEAAEAERPLAESPPLILPFAEMTPEERFRATTRLLFLAPDVPPIAPRPRRVEFRPTELRQLDDLLDERFSRDEAGDEREAGSSQRRNRRRTSSDARRRRKRTRRAASLGRRRSSPSRRRSRARPASKRRSSGGATGATPVDAAWSSPSPSSSRGVNRSIAR
ncbi:hypothetical protein [Leucobacter manosquensis]|uniref:hypothetical protein n=1 Tax=Leucobacter manosquensis TaxID=2810611 RepID=UPI003D27EA26